MATESATATNPASQQIFETIERGEKINVVDLFCGAGGMSSGAHRALESIAKRFDKAVPEIANLIAVNHWDCAIETHSRNYPWATHYQANVKELRPSDLYRDEESPLDDDDTIHLLIACPDCTYFSSARGGGPKDPDSRATPREILDFVEVLDVRNVLFENVPEFGDWGPLDDDNEVIEEQKGEYFDTWITQLTIEGFNVEYRVLDAADYGDATSRSRLFVCGRKDAGVSWPKQTHSEGGSSPGTEERRTAAEIIDWSDPGESLWVRDLRDGRRSPLAHNTMRRIAEGIRRHGHPDLEPFADVIERFGTERDRKKGKDVAVLDELRDTVVPAEHAGTVAAAVDEPFLVKYYGTSHSRPVDDPLDTVTSGGNKYALCQPYVLSQHVTGSPRGIDERPIPTIGATSRGISLCRPETFLLRQQSGGVPASVGDDPVPTVASAGAISRVTTDPFVLPKNGKQRGIFSNKSYDPDDSCIHTIVSGRADQGYLVTPSLIRYSHGGSRLDVDDPLPTITTARCGDYSVSSPYLVPFYSERDGQSPRTNSIDRSVPTVTASKINQGVVNPYLIEYYGNGRAQPVDQPVPTATTRDRFALVVPELYPLGIDILFRMLKPSELAAAMGFPEDYEFAGNKTETVKQIGNAVPVETSESLCTEMLIGSSPTLDSFDGGQGGVADDD